EREQTQPRGDVLLGGQSAEGHVDDVRAPHAVHRPGQAASAGERHVDVDRAGRPSGPLRDVPDEVLDLFGDRGERAVPQAPGRDVAAQQLGGVDVVGGTAGEAGRQGAVADGPLLQPVQVDGQPVAHLVRLAGDTDLQPVTQEAAPRVLEVADEVRQGDVLD